MSNSTEIKAIKRRAAKVDANPEVLAQFLKLAEADAYPMAKNGNSLAWRKSGVVARCSGAKEGDAFITYELSVKTVWEGRNYTTVTKIEKMHLSPADLKFSLVERAEVKTEWKSS
jgi:hypothetical protein